MYTVIIPTLWTPCSSKMRILFEEVANSPLVEEIILIDNNPTFSSITKREILQNIPKISHVRMDKNIYVNPAWNLGAERARTSYTVLLNDDFYTNVGVDSLLQIHHTHSNKSIGLYGVHESSYPNWYGVNCKEDIPDFEEELTIIEGGFSIGWGCCIILPTNLYPQIPNELKIWFGDNILLNHWELANLPTFNFKNLKVDQLSTTVRSDPEGFDSILKADAEYFNTLYN